jgi:hypothetical protein
VAISDLMRLTSFTIAPGACWDADVQVSRFPVGWLDSLTREYHRRPEIKDGWSLPSRSLAELLTGLDPAVMHVSSDLTAEHFITAHSAADTDVLATAIASWAATDVTPDDPDADWWDRFSPDDLRFEEAHLDLLSHSSHPNGTAAPAQAMFRLLPTFLAQQVVDAGLELLGKPRTFILGPPQTDGRRSAVLWPPQKITDEKAGEGLVTAKITFHVETVPNHPVPHVHADLSISRFPLAPVAYIPARGDGPPAATVWLYAPEGFLRRQEPHTLLAASAQHIWAKGTGTRQWQWKPGLASTLARLTHLTFPAPEKVFTDPATAADEGGIRAYILYSEGTRSEADDPDNLDTGDPDDTSAKPRSLRHAAKTGFVPADHIEVHERLADLLHPHGLLPLAPCRRRGNRVYRRAKPAEPAGEPYTLEVWAQSRNTREAVLAALQHHHGLTPSTDPHDPATIHFAGTPALRVVLKDVGTLGAGIERAEGDRRPQSTLLGLHAKRVLDEIGKSPEPRAAIFELEDDKYFSRIRKIDPKPALKKAFARSDRRLQCLRPAKLFKPPSRPWTSTKKRPPEPYPGTNLTVSTIHRASAAINDALRQLGRIGTYETPADLPDLEQIGIWLHHSGSTCIPIVIRLGTDGTATAYLASASRDPIAPISYSDLPKALAEGKGRIGSSPRQKAAIAQFLINALGVGGTGHDTHDRVVFARSASFRTWGWDWLQDKHIQPDRLALPGTDLSDPSQTSFLSPEECPGLRIIRVRDRSTTMEVARGFAADYDKTSPRSHGLFAFNDRIFYSVNPRPDQMQAPLSATKLDPDIQGNYFTQVSNPVPLEIYPAFLQPIDDAAAYAILTSRLRRIYLHTEQATRFPAVLHLCELADEYL